MNNLAVGIITLLTQYRSDEYIESIIVFTVQMGVTLNQSNVQCSIADLDNISTKLFVNTSGIIDDHCIITDSIFSLFSSS